MPRGARLDSPPTQEQLWRYQRDDDGRAYSVILPGGAEIGLKHDGNGNVVEVVPDGRTAHVFEYDPVDNLRRYDPPFMGVGLDDTQYQHRAPGTAPGTVLLCST